MVGRTPDASVWRVRAPEPRSRPKAYKFVYRVFNILVDVDTLDADTHRRRLFSYNRFNLFSFFDRDHGARDGSKLRPWVEKHLDAALDHGLVLPEELN